MKRKLESSIRTYSDASVDADTRESALADIQAYCQDSGMAALKTIIADHLGPFITDKKSYTRENAMKLLVKAVATVLQRATYAMDVTENDAHFLLTFFVQRFDDYDSVVPSAPRVFPPVPCVFPSVPRVVPSAAEGPVSHQYA